MPCTFTPRSAITTTRLRICHIFPSWNSVPIQHLLPVPSCSASGVHLSTFCFYEFGDSRDILWVGSFGVCLFVTSLLPPSMMSWRRIPLVACLRVSFLFSCLSNTPLHGWGPHLFIYLSIDRHLDCFHSIFILECFKFVGKLQRECRISSCPLWYICHS